MDRRHRQKPPGWTTGRSFLLFVALALAAAFIACARDLPDLGPTFAPLQTATPTTSPSTESSTRAVFGNVSVDEHVGRQEVSRQGSMARVPGHARTERRHLQREPGGVAMAGDG